MSFQFRSSKSKAWLEIVIVIFYSTPLPGCVGLVHVWKKRKKKPTSQTITHSLQLYLLTVVMCPCRQSTDLFQSEVSRWRWRRCWFHFPSLICLGRGSTRGGRAELTRTDNTVRDPLLSCLRTGFTLHRFEKPNFVWKLNFHILLFMVESQKWWYFLLKEVLKKMFK